MNSTPMKSLRTINIRSLTGHSCTLLKNKVVDVPNALVPEALSLGAVVDDSADLRKVIDTADERTDKTPIEPSGAERRDIILAAMEACVLTNNNEEFDSGNRPTCKALSARCEFAVTANERDTFWEEREREIAEAEQAKVAE